LFGKNNIKGEYEMCCKRFIGMVVAGFIFTFIYEYGVHEHLLATMYEETANLWRTPEEMEALCWMGIGARLAIVALLAFIFTRNYEGKGMGEGVRFGAYLGLYTGIGQASMYVYSPITMELALAWLSTTVVYTIAMGIIFSLICCKAKEDCGSCNTGS
jgi:hypothetical protein